MEWLPWSLGVVWVLRQPSRAQLIVVLSSSDAKHLELKGVPIVKERTRYNQLPEEHDLTGSFLENQGRRVVEGTTASHNPNQGVGQMAASADHRPSQLSSPLNHRGLMITVIVQHGESSGSSSNVVPETFQG